VDNTAGESKEEWEAAGMAEDPKQVDKDSGQGRAALHNKWVSGTITLLCILLVIVVALLVATALFDPFVALKSAWRWYFRPEPNPSMTERKDLVLGVASIIQAFAVLVAGVVALAGLYFTRRTLLHNQESTQETLDLTRRGQITERFTQAIEQLGATEEGKKNLEIRLGGIYSLERTAREDRDYHWPIMEVLTSYVRRNDAPSELDIQAILNVIGRRSIYHRTDKKVEYGTIDLSNTDLRGANLRGANLRDAVLQDAKLQDANLRDAQDANLAGTLSLQGATMPDGSIHP
jgi:hypothetical protein